MANGIQRQPRSSDNYTLRLASADTTSTNKLYAFANQVKAMFPVIEVERGSEIEVEYEIAPPYFDKKMLNQIGSQAKRAGVKYSIIEPGKGVFS